MFVSLEIVSSWEICWIAPLMLVKEQKKTTNSNRLSVAILEIQKLNEQVHKIQLGIGCKLGWSVYLAYTKWSECFLSMFCVRYSCTATIIIIITMALTSAPFFISILFRSMHTHAHSDPRILKHIIQNQLIHQQNKRVRLLTTVKKSKRFHCNVYGLRLCVLCEEQQCCVCIFFSRFALIFVARGLLARADEHYNDESNDGDGDDGYEIFSYLYNGNGRLKQITTD